MLQTKDLHIVSLEESWWANFVVNIFNKEFVKFNSALL